MRNGLYVYTAYWLCAIYLTSRQPLRCFSLSGGEEEEEEEEAAVFHSISQG